MSDITILPGGGSFKPTPLQIAMFLMAAIFVAIIFGGILIDSDLSPRESENSQDTVDENIDEASLTIDGFRPFIPRTFKLLIENQGGGGGGGSTQTGCGVTPSTGQCGGGNIVDHNTGQFICDNYTGNNGQTVCGNDPGDTKYDYTCQNGTWVKQSRVCYSPSTGGGGGGGGGSTTVPTNLTSTPQLAPNTTCTDSNYHIKLSWTGSGAGWFVDISEDASFGGWSNRDVSNLTNVVAPDQFSGNLSLQPGKTYYWRVYNGSTYSTTKNFNVPTCAGGGGGGGGGNTQYTFTATLDKSTYAVNDTAKLCYHLTPENVPYNLRLTLGPAGGTKVPVPIANSSGQIISNNGEFSDNGSGGGDCLNIPLNDGKTGNFEFNIAASKDGNAIGNKNLPYTVTGGTGGTQPTATNTPVPGQPTATNTPVPNQPTATNTPVPNQPTATNTPIPNQPTNTPIPGQPTATPNPNETRIALEYWLPGIGANTAQGLNNNPVRKALATEIEVYDAQNQKVKNQTATLNFALDTHSYKATVSLGNLATGPYSIRARFNNTLWKKTPALLTAANTTTVPAQQLIPGDIDQNNTLDLLDYNAVISCYGNKPCSNKEKADLNIDGKVDERDLNILYAGFATRMGD